MLSKNKQYDYGDSRICSPQAAMFRVVCSRPDKHLSGKIVSPFFAETEIFSDIGELILKLDDMCELLSCPMASTQRRSLGKGDCKLSIQQKPLLEEELQNNFNPYHIREVNNLEIDNASKKVFLIHVVCRQHSAMQGVITVFQRPYHKQHFRSALELMRMIDASVRAKT